MKSALRGASIKMLVCIYHGYWDSSAVDVGNGRLVWKGRERKEVRWCVCLWRERTELCCECVSWGMWLECRENKRRGTEMQVEWNRVSRKNLLLSIGLSIYKKFMIRPQHLNANQLSEISEHRINHSNMYLWEWERHSVDQDPKNGVHTWEV